MPKEEVKSEADAVQEAVDSAVVTPKPEPTPEAVEKNIEKVEKVVDEVKSDSSISLEGLQVELKEIKEMLETFSKDNKIAGRTGSKVGAQTVGVNNPVFDYINKKYNLKE